MPELTCRRLQDHHRECRHICYGDVHVGTISANADAAETRFEENDPEGIAFEYEVLE